MSINETKTINIFEAFQEIGNYQEEQIPFLLSIYQEITYVKIIYTLIHSFCTHS